MLISNFSTYTTCFIRNYYEKKKNFDHIRTIGPISCIKPLYLLNDIFNNTESVTYIKTNFNNSYIQLNEIYNLCKKKSKEIMFIISSGPMGKILIKKLVDDNYQCIDIGNL